VNLSYKEITGLGHVRFLDETVSIAIGVVSPWVHLAELTSLLVAAYVADASISLWRKGEPEDRRRAALVGGSIVLFVLVGQAVVVLFRLKILSAFYPVSLWSFSIVAAMALELGYDLFAAAQITQKLQLSEASLRESEGRFRLIADSAPVLVWMSGRDKLCTFFNKPWLEFTGRTIEQEMGNGWTEGVHPDDLRRCFKTYTAAFDARQPFVMQYRLRRQDGEYRWVSDNGVPRYDAQKNFTGYIGSCVDITESLNNQQALRESEERMSLALEKAGIGLWDFDFAKDELWGTELRRAQLGLPPGNIKLEDALSRVHVADRDRLWEILMEAVKTGKDYRCEYRVMFADGSERWTETRGAYVTRSDGKAVLRAVTIDVTERKRAEEKFRLAVEASPSGILLVNETGEIVLVNAHIEELFGYGREQLIGQSVETLVPERFARHHPEHRAKFFAAPTARAMGAGRELFGRRKDGSEFPVEIGLNPIETSEGILVLAAVVDISARKESESEALRHREELSHLSRVAAMGELAASIAHELNQPLSGITLNASTGQRLIDRGDGDLGELRQVLSDIVADARRAGEVIRGIQNMVKKGSSARQRLNLNNLVTETVRMVIPNAMLHSCELEILLEPGLPDIEADPVQMQQVLLNLVINALDAIQEAPVGRRKVLIATERTLTGAIRTSVRDYGYGIPEEVRARVFEQFFTTKAKGLGIGLAIVQTIIKSHGGSIVAENADGGGARFYFILPASRS
jgi:PAS domain S-box-containing protein